jgi:hypothetical protein
MPEEPSPSESARSNASTFLDRLIKTLPVVTLIVGVFIAGKVYRSELAEKADAAKVDEIERRLKTVEQAGATAAPAASVDKRIAELQTVTNNALEEASRANARLDVLVRPDPRSKPWSEAIRPTFQSALDAVNWQQAIDLDNQGSNGPLEHKVTFHFEIKDGEVRSAGTCQPGRCNGYGVAVAALRQLSNIDQTGCPCSGSATYDYGKKHLDIIKADAPRE